MGSNQMSESGLPLIMSNIIPTAPPPPIIQPPDPTKNVPITAEEVLIKIRERCLLFKILEINFILF
jgi:hypothetical protein